MVPEQTPPPSTITREARRAESGGNLLNMLPGERDVAESSPVLHRDFREHCGKGSEAALPPVPPAMLEFVGDAPEEAPGGT